jgi:hypothetical protein
VLGVDVVCKRLKIDLASKVDGVHRDLVWLPLLLRLLLLLAVAVLLLRRQRVRPRRQLAALHRDEGRLHKRLVDAVGRRDLAAVPIWLLLLLLLLLLLVELPWRHGPPHDQTLHHCRDVPWVRHVVQPLNVSSTRTRAEAVLLVLVPRQQLRWPQALHCCCCGRSTGLRDDGATCCCLAGAAALPQNAAARDPCCETSAESAAAGVRCVECQAGRHLPTRAHQHQGGTAALLAAAAARRSLRQPDAAAAPPQQQLQHAARGCVLVLG